MSATAATAVVLWDIDGTLLRAGDPDHIGGLAEALSERAGRPVSLEGVPLGGNVERRICRMALESSGVAGPHDAIVDDAIAALGRRYVASVRDRTDRLLPGVPAALDACAAAGMVQGVLTGGARRIARHKLEVAGLADRLRFGAYGDEAESREELVDHALAEAALLPDGTGGGAPGDGDGDGPGTRSAAGSRSELPRSRVVVVGDTPSDVEAARAAGVAVVGVASGRWSEPDLAAAGPDGLLADLSSAAEVVATITAALRRR